MGPTVQKEREKGGRKKCNTWKGGLWGMKAKRQEELSAAGSHILARGGKPGKKGTRRVNEKGRGARAKSQFTGPFVEIRINSGRKKTPCGNTKKGQTRRGKRNTGGKTGRGGTGGLLWGAGPLWRANTEVKSAGIPEGGRDEYVRSQKSLQLQLR